MSRFLRFCAFLFVLFFTGNVLAAGYTCPTTSYKKYTSCKAGYYMTLNGTYNGTPTVGNACTKCTTNEYCEGGTANKKIKCEAGYYLPANSTTCTICPAGSYCPGNEEFDPTASTSDRGIYSCPAASGSYLDTYTDMQTWVKSACSDSTSSNTTIIKAAITSWDSKKGKSEITGCGVDYTLNTPCGTLIKENVPYNTSTGKYDTYVNSAEVGYHYYSALAAGYYLDEQYSTTYCNTSTNRMLYKTAHKCPGGGLYCPGFTGSTLPLCNNTAWTYGEPVGMYGCGTGAASTGDGDGDDYWSSATGADARTDCYVRVNLYKNGGTGSITGDSTATGTTSGVKTCYYNTACTLPSASGLTQTGYKFSGGWGTTSSATSCSNSITLTSAKVASTNYYACKNPTYSITLNKNNGGSTGGTSTLYTTKTVGAYLDSARTQSLTTAGTYKVTMPTWAPEYYYSESEYPVIFDARPALGYYSSSDGGTQYVDADGVITTSGLTAAKGYGANATWHAQYDTMVTAPDAPANKVGYTFTGWCLDNSEDCAGGMTVAAGEEFDLNDLDGDLTAMWAPHTTIRITYNGENDADGADYIYAIEGVDGVYLDAAHTKRMTTTTNPITYPDLYTWDVSFTDSYTGTNITRSGIDADPDGVYDSNGTEMIDSRGYITTAGIAAAKATTYDGSGYNASWGMSWTRRPGTCVTVPDAPTRTGYTFDGWVTDQDDVFQPGDEYCSHEYTDTSLTANWEPNQYTITLDNASATTNGTASIYTTYNTNVYLDSSRSKAMTTSANAITVPSRTGYTFGGYYSASGGTGTQYINASGNITSDGLTAGKALQANGTWYAKWTANKYTITLDNANATTNGTASIYTTYNTNVYLDSSRSKAMTTSANPITKPSRVYTVTYNANSGSVSPTSATSTYTFKGYYSAASNGTQYINASGNITADGLTAGKGYTAAKTWNAQWTGASVTLPTPSRTGYTFGGWYKESALTNKVGDAGASYTPTANVTLYAKWTPCTYTVKFNSNKPSTATSTMSGTMSDQSFTYDVAQALTANAFNLPGYTFAGWATSSTGSVVHADEKSVSNLTTTCGGTVNLYAKWTANTITLSWANGGRGTAPTSPASCTYDGTFTTPAAMTATGYTFNKWSVNSNTFAASTSVACTYANLGGYSGAATITGTWTANTYTIVYNANKPSAASASVSGSTASSTHTYDTAKALTSNGFSLTGWSFAGWNTQADGSGTSYSNGASVKNLSATKGATVNLYAKWTQNCIPVTLDANGGTAGSVTKIYKKADATGWYSDSACATAYTTNANLKPSRSAYTFRGFYVEPVDDISASQTTAITRYLLSDASTSTTGTNWKINAARTLYAGWAKTCVQPSNGTCKFSHGDKAVYTTTCNTGYSISGNATATPSCSIITYTIKYMDGSAEITGLTPATYNVTTATFNLPTAYKATYKFVSWHTDSALSSTAETQIAKGTTGDKVYYVKWSTCPAGSVCDGDSVVSCPAGSYCAAGSSEATPCAKGSYSTGGATTCTLADKGYYVDTTGADKQIACPAGTYGSTTGLISAACSGKCSAGRYGNATAQTAATCNGACSAGYYCPAGSISATAYDCDTGTTTASSNNYWTSDSGAGARSSCYRNVVLDKNGMSGTLALPDSSGCKSLDTSTNTLVVYYGKACKLPTTVLSGTATGTTYTGTGTWATSANAASSFVSSITVTSEAATVTYYAGKMYTCSAGYYLKANTNGACTACASPYYCTGITNKYYSSSIQGRSACSALDSTKTDGTYSSVSPYNAATTCRFKQEQQTVPTYCETKASNTMKYTSSGWEANTYSVTAKSGAIISGNNTTGATCSQCAAGTYSAGGTDTTCDAISAGCYGGAGSATACPNQCSAGTYRTSTGGKTQSDCSNVTAGCYGSAGATTACPAVCATNNYSNAGASACTPCDSDYANSGDTAESHAGVASCKVTCPAGQYVATENAACSDVGSGYYRSGTETISQGNKGTREACNALNAFYTASDSGRDAATDCFGTTTGGNYIATPKAGQVTCAAGGYCAGGSKVYYEKTGGRTACSAGTANPNTGSSASSACVTCAAGKYNTTTGNASCLTCPANSYCTGGTNKTACNTVAGKLYTKSAEGSDAATDCYVTLASKVYLAKPTDTATTTCTAGYYCAGGDYHYSSTATNQGRSSCTGATYSGAGAASCSNCPSGYTANTSSNKTANTQCQISVTGGHYIAEAGQNSTNWGSCLAGYAKEAHTVNYGTTETCDKCTGATYAENAGQASCTACPTATNTSAQGVVSSYSYWISGDIHTTRSNCSAYFKTETLEHGTMNVYCYVDANADTYGVDGSSKLGCYVRKTGLTCDDGYYNAKFSTLGSSETQYNPGKTIALARASACTAVGEDYWSPANDWTRTACATGLTTCGSGKCANEADDCGRKLHAGDKVIHLRSAERTSPSLRVKLGDTVFYGNLVSPVDGTLKVKNGTSTYSVANDNQ